VINVRITLTDRFRERVGCGAKIVPLVVLFFVLLLFVIVDIVERRRRRRPNGRNDADRFDERIDESSFRIAL
jgi:hypothetical protein